MSPDGQQEIADKLDRILRILQGGHDSNGQWHTGVSPRLEGLELRVRTLEDIDSAAESRALNWRHAVGIALAGGGIGQVFTYVREHLTR